MDLKFSNLKNIVDRRLPDVTSRSPVLAAAVGFALARLAPLPSSAVEDELNYYNLSVSSAMCDLLNGLNESVIVNCNDAKQWSRNFWQMRYWAAHLSMNWVPVGPGVGFFDSYNRADALLSADQFELLNKNRDVVFELANELVWAMRSED